MSSVILQAIRYTLILLFGVSVSAAIADVRCTRKNFIILVLFCICDSIFQGVLTGAGSLEQVASLYPLVTHLPLLMLLVLVFRKDMLKSIMAITTAYLCCQVSNWMSTIPDYLSAPAWAVDLTYIITVVLVFPLVIRYIVPYISKLYDRENKSAVLMFGIVPVFYYVFDYIATVYTDLLYEGNIIISEFVPFLLCIYYVSFCVIYYRQYEEKQEIESRNMLMRLRQEQSEREVKALQQNERTAALLRHDMLHFLNNVSIFIEKGELTEAQEYIQTVIQTTRNTTAKKYCSNKMVNMILTSYGETFEENEINFSCTVNIPEELSISDVDITSILSNALENSLHAVMSPDSASRIIELSIMQKGEKLLIRLANSYGKKPQMKEGFPVTEQKGHGFGTQSIRYTVERLHGNCMFSVNEKRFVLQIVV